MGACTGKQQTKASREDAIKELMLSIEEIQITKKKIKDCALQGNLSKLNRLIKEIEVKQAKHRIMLDQIEMHITQAETRVCQCCMYFKQRMINAQVNQIEINKVNQMINQNQQNLEQLMGCDQQQTAEQSQLQKMLALQNAVGNQPLAFVPLQAPQIQQNELIQSEFES